MGSWGITMRRSDYGPELLRTVVETQLKKVNFSAFNVTEAIDVLRQDILEDIKRTMGTAFIWDLKNEMRANRILSTPQLISASTAD